MKVFGITVGRGGDAPPLMLGAQPVVNLLPPEVLAARRSRAVRRVVVAAAVVLVVGAGGGAAAARVQAIAAEVELAGAQARTAALIAQQGEFGDVLAVEAEIAERVAARHVVTSTEIEWRSMIDAFLATLPPDATLTSVAAEGSSPMALHAQPIAPLQGARVATLTFTVESDARLPQVLDALATLPGFVDAQVPVVTALETGRTETIFVLHVGEEAYANRFPPEAEAGAEASEDASTDADAGAEDDEG
ncbi:hypothetical protein [Agrococcus lahaulensis]|uniref:hypothetical protein n=1 Tax=Agrococcus lahaulensis TaxID=341722 RepID=UPI00047D1687|nr:hypothetical protein [Agrococcus lahaulensis]